MTKKKKYGHKQRRIMYGLFVTICAVPLLPVLLLSPYASTSLLAAGAAELAFGFYAFTSGSGAYSVAPTLWHKHIRRKALKKAEKIMSAARLISIGAALLIMGGVSAGVWDAGTVKSNPCAILLWKIGFVATTGFALLLVAWGAVRLDRNITYVNNEYLASRKKEDYHS